MDLLPESPDIVVLGSPSLFQVQPSVAETEITTDGFQHNLRILKESQLRFQGVGIAAPQIGWAARVMTFGIPSSNSRYPNAASFPIECWINPEIIWHSEATAWGWEGCLSVPGLRGWVERPGAIRLQGLDNQGQRIEKELDGFMAKVVQHELDHLDGRLFPSRVSSPDLLVPLSLFKNQHNWADDWPTPNARNTQPGAISLLR